MHSVGPLYPWTPSQESKTVVVTKNKSEYEWVHAIQSVVVQRSTVISCNGIGALGGFCIYHYKFTRKSYTVIS